MSRTDAHVPVRLRERSHEWRRHVLVVHDHRDGVCDLEMFLEQKYWSRTSCYTVYGWYGAPRACACWLCRGDFFKWNHRQVRTKWRGIRQSLKAIPLDSEEWEDVDVPVLRGKAW